MNRTTIDSSDSEEENDEVNKSTFCIRFTIGNNNKQSEKHNGQSIEKCPASSSCSENKSGSHQSLSSARQNVGYCDNPSFTRQNETSPLAHPIEGDHNNNNNNSRNNLKSTKKKTYRFIEPQNHKSALFVNLGSTSGCHHPNSDPLESQNQAAYKNYYTQRDNSNKRTDKRLFISPDLNAATGGAETLTPSTASSDTETVSVNSCTSPETALVDTPKSFDCSDSVFELLDPANEGNEDDDEEEEYSSNLYCEPRLSSDGTMSGSCNFMHWMSATKRRASSTNPTGGQAKSATSASSDTFKDLTNSTTVSGGSDVTNSSTGIGVGRRASSSDGLNQSPIESNNLLAASGRSASRNHLAISDSVETVCESRDQTQTNQRFIPCINDRDHAAILQPLDIRIDSPPPPPPDDDLGLLPLVGSIPADGQPELSFEAVLQIGIDDLQQAEDECRKLEKEAQYWEQKVEEMERKQFAEDVPRLLVEKIIKNRKELRDLDFQLYQHQLDSEDSDEQSCAERLSQVLHMYDCQRHHRKHDGSSSPSESNFNQVHLVGHHPHPREDGFITDFNNLGSGAGNNHGSATRMQQANSKVGSHIKPGQENTANILSAVPPSSSLQRQQYLSKASSGTDSSEYSQMPMFNHQHKHAVGAHHQHYRESSDRHHRQHQRSRHQQQQHHHQVYHQQQHLTSQRVSRHQQRDQESHQHQQTHMGVDACCEASEEPPTQSQNRRSMCSSPIRPNFFKSKFKQQHHALAQDSSSTASSSSPQ